MLVHLYKETYIKILTVLKDCRQSSGPSVVERLNKLLYLLAMKSYSTVVIKVR